VSSTINIGTATSSATKNINIGTDATGGDTSVTIGSDSSNTEIKLLGNISVGDITPTEVLDIDGKIRIRGGSPGSGKLLQSDVDGSALWVSPLAANSKWEIVLADTAIDPRWDSDSTHFGLD
ncbi:MAG: hypothetical protein ACOC3V_03370, partial [bacterium]